MNGQQMAGSMVQGGGSGGPMNVGQVNPIGKLSPPCLALPCT